VNSVAVLPIAVALGEIPLLKGCEDVRLHGEVESLVLASASFAERRRIAERLRTAAAISGRLGCAFIAWLLGCGTQSG